MSVDRLTLNHVNQGASLLEHSLVIQNHLHDPKYVMYFIKAGAKEHRDDEHLIWIIDLGGRSHPVPHQGIVDLCVRTRPGPGAGAAMSPTRAVIC